MPSTISSILNSPALQKHKHVCAIFNTRDEARDIMGEFIAEGCKRGHKTMFLLDPDLADEAVQNLEENGVDVAEASASGKFDLKIWKETYLRGDSFTCDGVLDFIDESMSAAHNEGHDCIWAAGDMNWAGRNPETSAELIAYESKLNNLKPQFGDDIWICFYDASQFNGRVIADVIRAHPVVLMGKKVFENPFYMPPLELARELADYKQYKPSRA